MMRSFLLFASSGVSVSALRPSADSECENPQDERPAQVAKNPFRIESVLSDFPAQPQIQQLESAEAKIRKLTAEKKTMEERIDELEVTNASLKQKSTRFIFRTLHHFITILIFDTVY